MKKSKIVCLSCVALIVAFLVVVNVACGIYARYIDAFLVPAHMDSATRAEGKELAFNIEEEGIVLTENRDNVLPLSRSETRVNVFGWSATQWVRSGDGSGRSGNSRSSIRYDLLSALEYRNIQYNENIISRYRWFRSSDREFTNSLSSANEEFSRLYEPSIHDTDVFRAADLAQAKEFSDVALVVLGRVAGESCDSPKVQYKQTERNGDIVTDDSRTYLDISAEEEELLTYVGENYDKVIVIVNSTNVMNLGFMDSIEGLDACLIVCGTGAYGALAILNTLYGVTESPSGRTPDTYVYDFKSSPAYATAGAEGLGAYTNAGGFYPTTVTYTSDGKNNPFPQVSYVDYVEDIYVGYKWYETADAESYFDGVQNQYGSGYEGVVQYPFGYGLSYTTFSKEVLERSPDGNTLEEDDEISVKVRVTNTGDYAGREVVQLYYTPQYYEGGIEKAHVNLAAFAKTSLLQPGEYEDVTLTFKATDMASYDCYGKNDDGFKGYVLEHGTYRIALMKNAHEAEEVTGGEGAAEYTVSSDILIEEDPVSGEKVENRFTGEDAVDGVSLDGTTDGQRNSATGEGIVYLTRADFEGTFPTEKVANRAIRDEVCALNTYTDERMAADLADESDQPITTDADNGLRVMENGQITDLGLALGADYEDERWEALLDQLSVSEMENVVLHGYGQVKAISSVGMPAQTSTDGPAQIGSWGSVVNNPDDTTTPFPQATVLAQTWNPQTAYSFGLAMGKEARAVGVDCWYGPGINLHCHPFAGRNYEYWSEDGCLSGVMCAQTVRGAKNVGVYSTIKHLALYNTETYRDGQYVWLTEQNLRENYLKSFRIAIQQGGATGLMSSYNRIGAVWTGASSALQQEVIRNEFGFRGLIITDYCDHKTEKGHMMLGDAMIRNGGDLWMDGSNGATPDGGRFIFDHSSTENQFNRALRKASKNIIYTYLNAIYTNDEYNRSSGDDAIVITRGNSGISWWVFVLGALDVLAAGGCAFWVYRAFFHRKRSLDEPKEEKQ